MNKCLFFSLVVILVVQNVEAVGGNQVPVQPVIDGMEAMLIGEGNNAPVGGQFVLHRVDFNNPVIRFFLEQQKIEHEARRAAYMAERRARLIPNAAQLLEARNRR